ncbi:phosphatidylserine decarboxylase-domain-containing protein [Lasiosphaeria miniovina]|uniref:Phosphatidylserine decarboxylase-domain-containing protein n=1 Tax=Lasiosphaeria miniovina TaxID=1954250 RepID=A0AA40DNS2_9PEZI|nr:phosphatidylserine decarboxylase-domain-containing protein [Lasiosphaeria miniovina]KAK0710030.1 phosphatidylserine decarboxylase-domain-containing protein [Lasiosphaeria miniovina]
MSTPQVIQDFYTVLGQLGGQDALDATVAAALFLAKDVLTDAGITDGTSFVNWIITSLLQWVPKENSESTELMQQLIIFYFVLDQAPLGLDQTQIYPNSVGNGLTPLSAWIVEFADALGTWFNDPQSLTSDSFKTFVNSPLYRVWECSSPDGSAFNNFNQFFGRQLATPRKVAGPGDNKTPVYPADSHWDNFFAVDSGSNTWIPAADGDPESKGLITAKGWTWSVGALLQDSPYASSFAGGVWVHSFLSTFNYHHFRSPVSGTVIESRVIQNAAYLDVTATNGKLGARRGIKKGVKAGDAGVQIVAQDQSGYQFLQTRGLVIIDTSTSTEGDIGLVALLPMGMAQVSSVILTVKPQQTIEKGGEIGFFQFGGSDIVTVFQAKAGFSNTDPTFWNQATSVDEKGNPLPYTFYGTSLIANPSSKAK